MEKVLTYEEYVKVKNLLTKIKGQMNTVDRTKEAVLETIEEINKIINIDV